jgi:hypothetical protein
VTLNAGLTIPVRLIDGIASDRNKPGDTFTATLDKELVVDGFVIAERGARAEGKVVAAQHGDLRNVSAVAVELTAIHLSDGQTVAIATDSFEKHGDKDAGADTTKVAGGAVIGAVIGGIAAGGKGAAIGAGAGAATGTGVMVAGHEKPTQLPSETRITFRLRNAVKITERKG